MRTAAVGRGMRGSYCASLAQAIPVSVGNWRLPALREPSTHSLHGRLRQQFNAFFTRARSDRLKMVEQSLFSERIKSVQSNA